MNLPVAPASRSLFRLLAAAAVVWCLFLGWLVATSANPVVLNPLQLRLSHLVVVVDQSSPDGKLRVREVWSGVGDPHAEVQLSPPLKLPPGDQRWIVPIQAIGKGKYRITSGLLPQVVPTKDEKYRVAKVAPNVYPMTPQTRSELQQILNRVEPLATF